MRGAQLLEDFRREDAVGRERADQLLAAQLEDGRLGEAGGEDCVEIVRVEGDGARGAFVHHAGSWRGHFRPVFPRWSRLSALTFHDQLGSAGQRRGEDGDDAVLNEEDAAQLGLGADVDA